MGLTSRRISAAELCESDFVRLDPRFYDLFDVAKKVMDGLVDPVPLAEPLISFSNGPNLPASAYADPDEDVGAHYASVSPFALFSFRVNNCIPLRAQEDGTVAGLRRPPDELRLLPTDVAITRSATPGIAWPGALAPADIPVIPSGFIIRGRCSDLLNPAYLSAILNHPLWRMLSTALAAGKAQNNLSQELLRGIRIPNLDRAAQDRIAADYAQCLRAIEHELAAAGDFVEKCDGVLEEVCGLEPAAAVHQRVSTLRVSAHDICETRELRLDGRWHSRPNRKVVGILADIPTRSLGSLLSGAPRKRSQPTIHTELTLEPDTPRVVATVSVQSGQVVPELTKPTDEDTALRLLLEAGDLLVAMDGVGSLGKAAIFDLDLVATVDSHLAVCRTTELDTAKVLACLLNSSMGRTQTESLMSGATGQTQLGIEDLSAVRVPEDLLDESSRVASAYDALLSEYTRVGRRVRAELCRFEAVLTQELVDVGALVLDDEHLRLYTDSAALAALLEQLYPTTR